MEIIKKYLTNGQYLTAEYEKNSLFLHHTAGLNAEGAWQWWNQTPERVGTPFIIDRNGSVIECFNPKVWAFHLGITGDDNFHEMHSVSIELVAGGQLYEKGNEYYFYPLYPNIQYFTKIAKEETITFKQPWRGFNTYHIYTDKQLESLKEVINYTLSMFPTIQIQAPLGKFYEFNTEIITNHRGGLWSHSTVRADKTDIIPQPSLLQMLEEIAKPSQSPESVPEKTEIKTAPSNTNKRKKN